MKKPSAEQRRHSEATGMPDIAFAKRYPQLTEHLVTTQWEDGSARVPSKFAVSIYDGMVQMALNDLDLKQSVYTAAGTLAEAMELLERALSDGSAQWRSWKAGKGKKG